MLSHQANDRFVAVHVRPRQQKKSEARHRGDDDERDYNPVLSEKTHRLTKLDGYKIDNLISALAWIRFDHRNFAGECPVAAHFKSDFPKRWLRPLHLIGTVQVAHVLLKSGILAD
jgi:hypothetical protein